MITRFHVQNYKALKDATLRLTPVHVLIGPNESGKTSLLEAIAALCRSVDHRLAASFIGNWSNRDIVWRQDPNLPIAFDISAEHNRVSFDYQLSMMIHRRDAILHTSERIVRSQGNYDLKPNDPNVSRVFQSAPSAPSKEGEIEACKLVYDMLRPIHFYHWHPYYLSLSVAQTPERHFRIDRSGFGLALCLDDVLNHDFELAAQLQQRFRRIFPNVRGIGLERVEGHLVTDSDGSEETPQLGKTAQGKEIRFKLRTGESIPASQASDGMLLVLAYLTVLYLPDACQPRVLLVEEPENGIHPRRLKEIL